MKRMMKTTLALLLCLLMLMSTAAVSFAAGPGTVKGLQATVITDLVVKLKWNAVSGADGYRVERYSASADAWTQVAKTTSTVWKDTSVAAGKAYSYRVRAYQGKTTGGYSAVLDVLTQPEAVTSVDAKVKDGQTVVLSWEAAAGATVYKIYRKDAFSSNYKAVGSSKATSYTVKSGYATGKTYYCVRSFAKQNGMTSFAANSPAAKVTVKPGALAAVSASNQTAASVTLSWDAVPGANRYVIEQRDAATEKQFVALATVKKTTHQVKMDCSHGVVYFRVRPVSTNGTVTISGTVSPAVKLAFKPKKVAAVTLKNATYNSLTLFWTKADGASNYLIYEVNAAGKRTLIGETAETTYQIKGLASDSTHTYVVRAVSEYAGTTYRAAFSPALTASTTFGTVAKLKFSLDSTNQLYLLWDALTDVDGYEVEKLVGGSWKLIGNVKDTVFDATAAESGKTLNPGQEYSYRVRAYFKDGSEMVYSEYSEVLTVRAVPDVPKNLKTATGSGHSIVMEWDAVPGAEMYDIYYYDNDLGEWRFGERTAGGIYVNDKGVARAYYAEKNIEKSGDYQYRVRAVVLNGETAEEGGYHSRFSDVVTHHYVYAEEPQADFAPGVMKSGILGYLYDEKEKVFYTADDPWQRNFGFNATYDIASQFVMIQYDTTRIKFKYQGRDWMIQPWKGQYGMVLYGGEVGVYVKYTDRDAEHYDCAADDDRLMMAMSLYRYDSDKQEWVHEFDRPYGTYWWITGFTPGFIRFTTPGKAQSFQTYPDLRLDVRVTMKDFEMLQGVTKALKELDMPYTVSGLDVYFSF
ncbi:MAG: DUF4474 domain-containing protein [Clostridia bacterium]|nr:DUF4474 domain-containing protein [Clostridia bacterium]